MTIDAWHSFKLFYATFKSTNISYGALKYIDKIDFLWLLMPDILLNFFNGTFKSTNILDRILK